MDLPKQSICNDICYFPENDFLIYIQNSQKDGLHINKLKIGKSNKVEEINYLDPSFLNCLKVLDCNRLIGSNNQK